MVPKLPRRVVQAVMPSESFWINSVDSAIESLNRVANSLPIKYGWNYRTAEAFVAELKERTAGEVKILDQNRFYWEDMLSTFEAYSMMCSWRIADLARSTVWALSRDDIHCGALAARASLEATARYVDTARIVSFTTEPITSRTLQERLCISRDLESILVKTVFASRLPDGADIYKDTNILTVIQRINKSEGQEHILSNYEMLCEAAHQNFLGRSIYIMETRQASRPGHEIRTIMRGRGPTSIAITEAAIQALSWACITHVTAFGLMQETIHSLLERLESGIKL
jgi:hypothetical protein